MRNHEQKSAASRAALALAACALLAGCGGSAVGYPAAKLAGRVTVDGAPVAKGSVSFIPLATAGSKAQPTSAPIVDGQYAAADVPRGKVTVMIAASKATGREIKEYSEAYPEEVSIVPKKYQAGLPLDVSGDKNDQNFDLTSK